MAERNIIKIGDPVLRKVCKPVTELTPSILKLLDDMADTLHAAPNRAGLAAPQVGILRRLISIDCGDGLIELINPEIVEKSGEQMGLEACLSLPGFIGKVKRADQVLVKTLNRLGEEIFIEGKGSLARCILHEMDHLDGILYIDHMEPGHLFNEQTNDKVNLFEMLRYSHPKV